MKYIIIIILIIIIFNIINNLLNNKIYDFYKNKQTIYVIIGNQLGNCLRIITVISNTIIYLCPAKVIMKSHQHI